MVVWAAVFLFVLYPLGRLLVLVFWNEGPSLDAVRGLVTDWTHRAALVNSLVLAALVGVAGTVLGFAFALLALRAGLPRWLGRVLDAVVLLPLISPPFTAAIALIFALGPRGLISYHVFGLTNVSIYGLSGTFLSETLTYFPIAYLTLKAVIANIDPNLEDSAFSLGARRRRVFRTVTVPLAIPGIANAFLLVSAASLADFATPLILAGTKFPVLPTQAFVQITGLYDMRGGAALCFLLLVPALAIFVGQRRWIERRGGSYVTVTGKLGAVTRIKSLSPVAIAGLGVLCGAVALLVLVCYSLIAAASLVKGLGADNRLSFVHYAHVFSGGLGGARHADHRGPLHARWRPLRSGAGLPRRAHRVSRAPRPGVCRHDELRAARHHRRHRLSGRLQRPAPRPHGHRLHPRRLLRVPLQPGGDPRHHGRARADRSLARGSLREPRRTP